MWTGLRGEIARIARGFTVLVRRHYIFLENELTSLLSPAALLTKTRVSLQGKDPVFLSTVRDGTDTKQGRQTRVYFLANLQILWPAFIHKLTKTSANSRRTRPLFATLFSLVTSLLQLNGPSTLGGLSPFPAAPVSLSSSPFPLF